MSEQALDDLESGIQRAGWVPAEQALELVAEVRRLRVIETAAARADDVWLGFDETEKFKAWRALNVALHQRP